MQTSRLACLLLLILAAPLGAAPLFETMELFPSAPDNKPNYRIPSIIRAPNNDILAIVERRNHGIGDVGDIDIVMRRSADRGRTWSGIQTLVDDGANTSTDITTCIDWETGRIFVFFLRDKKKYAYVASDDSGKTWTGIVMIHDSVTKPEWDRLGLKPGRDVDSSTDPESDKKASKVVQWKRNWIQRYGVGPGSAGIQLKHGSHKGRLLIPGRHMEQEGKSRPGYTHVFYSDDHGRTWRLGATKIIKYGNENQLVELPDGTIMMNARNVYSRSAPDNARRLVALSRDGGLTWPTVWHDEALVSLPCHAATLLYNHPASPDNGLLLFANPASPFRQKEHPYGRYNMTVRWSRDNGNTWSAGRMIYPHTSSYNDMTVLDDGTIAMIYERGDQGSVKYWDSLHFVRFNLEWLFAPPRAPWNP
ncbi:MAG: glycoside hydrolase [Opitutaceae bacterium]|jgi:sialidase-1|nr:glycoside hydrolase [Opitutaceae bacterium]